MSSSATKLLRSRLVRTYATRRAERPPSRYPDPLAKVEGVQVAPNLTFFHRPPPSAPTPESLTTAPASPLLRPPTSTDPSSSSSAKRLRLPPPVAGKLPEEKKRHLTEAQMNEIRRLRAEDPVANTRSKLAKQFNTSSWFISTVARAPKEHKKELDDAIERRRASWGERKRIAVEVRKKRREFW